MPSIKCPNCSCVNFPDAPSCKRCKQSFVQLSNAEEIPKPVVKQQSGESSSGESSVNPSGNSLAREFNLTVRRDGALLVMSQDDVLPDRCVKCNQPSTQLLKRKAEWAPWYVEFFALCGGMILDFFVRDGVPWYVELLILFGGLVPFILYFFIRNRALVYLPFCDWHIKRRRLGLGIGGSLLGLGLFLGIVVVVSQDYILGLYGGVSAIAGAFVLVLFATTVKTKRIEQPYVWFEGVHKDFLDSLPVS